MEKRYTVVVNDNGTAWFKEGTKTLHREGGPAFTSHEGTKEWFINGIRHREDGPAYEAVGGGRGWYLNGKWLSKDDWEIALNPPTDSCDGKMVEMDGKKYKLTLVK